jgi:hypothetical protein
MSGNLEREIRLVANEYSKLVSNIDKRARRDKERAYGGILRAEKGGLVESLGRKIVEIAWRSLGGSSERLSFPTKRDKIQIRQEYIDRLPDPEIKRFIEANKSSYFILHGCDIHVAIDEHFVLAIECKAFTENAMLKRILVDCSLLKQLYPDLKFVLLQLESQLGGDYSELKNVTFGSTSTHTLLSYFNIDLTVITLLKGERKVDRPIHKKEFYKALELESVRNAVAAVAGILRGAI